MMTRTVRMFAIVLALAISAVSQAALAQSSVPAREGNIWNGIDHQPTRAETSQREKAANIAPSRSQEDRDATDVDELYWQLLHRSPD